MKARSLMFILFALPVMAVFAQRVSYDDVAVIINQENSTSVEIGEYFAANRNIPSQNLIYIQCTSAEVTDSLGFVDIRGQIEQAFENQGLDGNINYLVTTKGIPFNVRKSEDCGGLDGLKYCSSFDSELSLVFSQWSGNILDDGLVSNPYYDQWEYFDHEKYGIMLVSRLDGYSFQDVKALIDRSGPGVEVVKGLAKFVIDFSYVTDESVKSLLTEYVQPAINYLQLNEWQVVFDPGDELLTGQEHVLGYFNVNYQPSNKVLDFDWMQGSISEILLSTGNLTFYKEQNYFNELSAPDLLAEGATSTSTYANTTYFSLIVQIDKLYERYLDVTMRPAFNLAESYYMAMPALSNQCILIGDPKSSLAIQQNQVAETANNNRMFLFPNPAGETASLTFYCTVPGNYRLDIIDLSGKVVDSRQLVCSKGIEDQSLHLGTLPGGLYVAALTGPDQVIRTFRFMKE